MKRYICVLLMVITTFVSCSDVVDTNITEIDEKIFITSFISPENDTLTVNVSKTLSALGLEFNLENDTENLNKFLINDAIVTIADNSDNSILLPYLEDTFNYVASSENFPILPGESYRLEVLVEGNFYTANCSIPLENILEINEQFNVVESEFGGEEYQLNLNFTDIENIDNFYFIGSYLEARGEEFSGRRNLSFDTEAYQTDNLGDGTTISANTTFFPIYGFENDTQQFEDQDLVLQVMNAEAPLYELLKATYLNDINEFNPFIELSISPNNIVGEGGTGLFASYRYFEKKILLEEQ